MTTLGSSARTVAVRGESRTSAISPNEAPAARIGREHAVPTPNLEAAYAILQPWALRNEHPVEDRVPIPT